jgi:Protein of unknown function (DUF2934)
MTAMPPNFDPLRFCEKPKVPVQERELWIATAAYFRAERRGFVPGWDAEDWREAEREIEARLTNSFVD